MGTNNYLKQDFVILPGGVHVWGPYDHNLSGVPDDVIDERSKGYTLNLLETPGWRKLESDKIQVMGDIPDQALKVRGRNRRRTKRDVDA